MPCTEPRRTISFHGLVALMAAASLLTTACSSRPPTSSPSSVTRLAPTTSSPTSDGTRASAKLQQLERRFHATVGVYALDTGTGTTVTYRPDERFAFCSTFKALEAGVLLRRHTDDQLAALITYGPADVLPNSPVTEQHQATGMSLDALIAAAVQHSDNTAANLLLAELGGPSGLERGLRSIGDQTTNVDRNEPALSSAIPGDLRDTTTPRAIATDLHDFVLGDLLALARRQKLTELLLGNTTGGPYIRAGVPADWKVGDKTGHGDYGTRNDIAVVWPPGRRPLVIAVLSRREEQNSQSQDTLLADITKVIVAEMS